jgi:hypothetical protein
MVELVAEKPIGNKISSIAFRKIKGLFGSRPKFGSSHTCGKPYFVAKLLHMIGDQSLAKKKKQWQLFGLLPRTSGLSPKV